MDQPTPRVNKGTLSRYVHNTVRLIGKITQTRQATLSILEPSDGGQVSIHTPSGVHYSSPMVEIIGVVNEDLTVRELTHTDLGEHFDLGMYNELVKLSQQVPEIFIKS